MSEATRLGASSVKNRATAMESGTAITNAEIEETTVPVVVIDNPVVPEAPAEFVPLTPEEIAVVELPATGSDGYAVAFWATAILFAGFILTTITRRKTNLKG